MLNIMLKRAYDDLNNRIIDLNRYIYFTSYSWLEKVIHEYKDKGEDLFIKKQDKDVYEAIKNGIIGKLNFWEVMLKLDSEVC